MGEVCAATDEGIGKEDDLARQRDRRATRTLGSMSVYETLCYGILDTDEALGFGK